MQLNIENENQSTPTESKVQEQEAMPEETTAAETLIKEAMPPEKKKRSPAKAFGKALLWIALIIFIIWLTLFISSKIAGFVDVRDMFIFIQTQI